MDQELENIYNSAKSAISDDLRQNYYRAAQNRTQAFRQINNKANRYHAMFSGMPAANQMQYDQQTYLPQMKSLALQAINQQQQNQEAWDKHMAYVSQLNAQADYYNKLAAQYNSSANKFSEGQ